MGTKGFMPVNLQFFGNAADGGWAVSEAGDEKAKGLGKEGAQKERAEGPEKGRAEGTTKGSAEGPENERAEGPEGPGGPGGPSLNALLAGDKGLQSQFDKLVGKALATAQAKWEREKSMTAEQLAEAKAQEKSQELAQREQALRGKELRVEALELLGGKGIPVELIDCVTLTDGEEMRASVAKAERAFRAAVEKAVRERMTGTAPRSGASPAAAYMAQFRAAAGIKSK